MVVVWSVSERCPVARCLGHNSWISGVAFDATFCLTSKHVSDRMDLGGAGGGRGLGREARGGGGNGGVLSDDGTNYRFLSVAQDGRLCMWDLNAGNLVVSRKRAGGGARRSSACSSWSEAAAKSALINVADLSRADDIPSIEPSNNALISRDVTSPPMPLP